MTETFENPTCISIIVCEQVYRDETSKNLIICGTFNQINAAQFPVTWPRLHVLFTLTNGRGKINATLSIEHEATGQPVLEIVGEMAMNDPLSIQDFDIQVHGLTFPEPGKYWIVLKADDEIIGQRPIILSKAKEKETSEGAA